MVHVVEFNLRFKSIKKSTCNICDMFEAHSQTAGVESAEEKQKIVEHDVHIKAGQDT